MLNDEQLAWLRERFEFRDIDQLPVYGSLREFYRISRRDDTRVAVFDADITQFRLSISRAELFHRLKVSVPRIYDFSESLNIILEDDLGDDSLETIVNHSDDKLKYYYEVIDVLTAWQRLFDESRSAFSDYKLVDYDVSFARNETRLFTERYLKNYLRMPESKYSSLYALFDELAEKTSQLPKTLMHRDFQARNIQWHLDQPFFIDFQAAMLGPYTYDLAALVYDNHVDLNVAQKEELIEDFFQSFPAQDREDFYLAALQRTLQAISAYAFLSNERGLKRYEPYIGVGLGHLGLINRTYKRSDFNFDILLKIIRQNKIG